MESVFLSRGFLLPFLGCTVVAAILWWLVGWYWSRADAPDRTLNWNAFSTPISTAVTVSGVVIPLIASLFVYATGTLGKTAADLSPLLASAALMTLAALRGLWTLFSLGTQVTGNEGTFRITRTLNSYYPAALVAQLFLLLCAFGLLLLQAPKLATSTAITPSDARAAEHTLFLARAYPTIGMTLDKATAHLGTPTSTSDDKGRTKYVYLTTNSELQLIAERGEIVEIHEAKRTTK